MGVADRGGWIECGEWQSPIRGATMIECKILASRETVVLGRAYDFDWSRCGQDEGIIAYRVVSL